MHLIYSNLLTGLPTADLKFIISCLNLEVFSSLPSRRLNLMSQHSSGAPFLALSDFLTINFDILEFKAYHETREYKTCEP